MDTWPKIKKMGGGTERLCEHGVGHPDPDDMPHPDGIHGCDGCCAPALERCACGAPGTYCNGCKQADYEESA